eukprot:s818_g8.t1
MLLLVGRRKPGGAVADHQGQGRGDLLKAFSQQSHSNGFTWQNTLLGSSEQNIGALGPLLPRRPPGPTHAEHPKAKDDLEFGPHERFEGVFECRETRETSRHPTRHGSEGAADPEGAASTAERMGIGAIRALKGKGANIRLCDVKHWSLGDLVGTAHRQPDSKMPVPTEDHRTVSKGSVKDAIDIAKGKGFAKVVDKFKRKFFAASSERSRMCKRSEVMQLAREVAGNKRPLPLDRGIIEGVAAALKEAGLKSGQQYMTELKLLHVEAGYEIDAGLKRTLDLCKRSLERERGPVTRAAEVKVETFVSLPPPESGLRKGTPEMASAMFLWAAIWMLREIEVRNMKVNHVRLRQAERAITICLPISKCDQLGLGIRRTLRCSCGQGCKTWCPWRLAMDLVADAKVKGFWGGSFLFRDPRGAQTSKSGTVKKWKELFGKETSGHSPRRSGAMFYVRRGLPIQELAFLGRWKSGVVLQYAEEALQEKPVEIPLEAKLATSSAPLPAPVRMVDKPMALNEVRIEENVKSPPEDEDVTMAAAFGKPKDLWVVTKGKGWRNRPRHQVTKAAWSLPIKEWTTACGWCFASHSSEFYFLSGSQVDKMKCNKCQAHQEARHVIEAEKKRLSAPMKRKNMNGANAQMASDGCDASSTNVKKLKNLGGRAEKKRLSAPMKRKNMNGLGACVVNWSSFLTPARRQQLKTTVLRYAEPCEHLSPELQELCKDLNSMDFSEGSPKARMFQLQTDEDGDSDEVAQEDAEEDEVEDEEEDEDEDEEEDEDEVGVADVEDEDEVDVEGEFGLFFVNVGLQRPEFVAMRLTVPPSELACEPVVGVGRSWYRNFVGFRIQLPDFVAMRPMVPPSELQWPRQALPVPRQTAKEKAD